MYAILRSRSQNDLLDAVSQVMVEFGGFAMANVALHNPASNELLPVARYGDELGYLDRVRMFTDNRPEGLGAAGIAFRQGKATIVNDFLNDPRNGAWSEAARVSGWRSSAAIPIRADGKTLGILGVYSRDAGFFGEEERELLEQVALDLGFALENLEKEAHRRRVEASLIATERRLELALESGGIGIFERDLQTGLIEWTGQTARLLGYTPEEFDTTNSGFYSRVHPDDLAGLQRDLEQSRVTSTPFAVEYRVVWPDGSVHWMSSRGEFFRDESGAVRLRGAFKDITDTKQAQEEHTKLAAMIAMNRDFIGIAELSGKVEYLNPAAMALVGIESIAEARSKNLSEFSPDTETIGQMLSALEAEGYWIGESKLRHFGDGSLIDVEITGFVIADPDGKPLYLATVTRDIRERKREAAERAKLESQLAQSAKMESIGRLAGGVAHDFNNMLTVILGYSSLIRDSVPPDWPQLRRLNEIITAAHRSKDLTQKLLGFSRRQIIAPVPSNLNELVADLEEPLARVIGEDIELRFHPAQDLWKVAVDHSQINQILLNLVVNARDAMPKGGKLTVETANVAVSQEYCRIQPGATPGQFVLLAVSDTGIGMDEETLSQIFEPFFTTKGREMGTGLGLAMVYGIVKQNGGFVTVYSELAHGTTFKIYFPKVTATAGVENMTGKPEHAPVGRGATILLVEDDDLVRTMAAETLTSIGYKPLVAATPKEAIEICQRVESEIHLMLADVVLPGMNGMELRERVLALRPGLDVLFMSGYTSNVIVNHGVLKKGVNFIQKPFSKEDLARSLDTVLMAKKL